MNKAAKADTTMSSPDPSTQWASFNWEDPFRFEQQLTDEETMVADTARQYAQDNLAPRVNLRLCCQPGLTRITLAAFVVGHDGLGINNRRTVFGSSYQEIEDILTRDASTWGRHARHGRNPEAIA